MGIIPILSPHFLGVGFIPVKVKKDKPMDNENQAPVIPSGTEPIGNDIFKAKSLWSLHRQFNLSIAETIFNLLPIW